MEVVRFFGLFCLLRIGVAARSPWYNGGFRQMYPLRSRQSPGYRNIDDVELRCNRWKHLFETEFEGYFYGGITQRGYLCFKSEAPVKILSWCAFDEYTDNSNLMLLRPTVVDRRKPYFSTCEIFDVTIRAEYNGGSCFFMLIGGALFCVDEVELQPEYQTLTVYPTIDPIGLGAPDVNYIICSTSMSYYCPGPAKVLSHDDEEFRSFGCVASGTGSACLG